MLTKKLIVPFLVALALILFVPLYFPFLKLTFFAPFLIFVYYRKNFYASLWYAMGLGLIVDLLSTHTFFGLHALVYFCTTCIIYWQRRSFFEEALSTLMIMTSLFCCVGTMIHVAVCYFFGENILLSKKWWLSDFVLMPLIDGAYAFLVFTIPSIFFDKFKKRRVDL